MAVYIDRNKLLQSIENTVIFSGRRSFNITSEIRGANKVLNAIKAAPAEDVVEVVRCKDCKHRTKETRYTRAGFCGRRGAGDFFVAPPDGFCSYGERKDEQDG